MCSGAPRTPLLGRRHLARISTRAVLVGLVAVVVRSRVPQPASRVRTWSCWIEMGLRVAYTAVRTRRVVHIDPVRTVVAIEVLASVLEETAASAHCAV